MIESKLAILGHKVEDAGTGFEGVAVSVCFDICGAVQVLVQPPARDNIIEEAKWFDYPRLWQGEKVLNLGGAYVE